LSAAGHIRQALREIGRGACHPPPRNAIQSRALMAKGGCERPSLLVLPPAPLMFSGRGTRSSNPTRIDAGEYALIGSPQAARFAIKSNQQRPPPPRWRHIIGQDPSRRQNAPCHASFLPDGPRAARPARWKPEARLGLIAVARPPGAGAICR